jgi:hypothetical protein
LYVFGRDLAKKLDFNVRHIMLYEWIERAIDHAVRAGGLIRYVVDLEPGQFDNRQLWMRPEICNLLVCGKLDPRQRELVRAALKRFIVGRPITVVTKECRHKEVGNLGDFRELKGDPPPFVEMRFKPPKHDLRFFGRCISTDRLILTSYGMKSLMEPTGEKPLSVPEHRKRCDAFFATYRLNPKLVPPAITESFTNAEFL